MEELNYLPMILSFAAIAIALITLAMKSYRIDTNSDPFSPGNLDDMKVYREMIEYSDRIIAYIHRYIAEIAVIKFREFVDSKDSMSSVTRAQVESLISSVANVAYSHLVIDNIDIDHLMFDEKFLQELVPQVSANVIKDLLLKEIDQT